MYIRYMALQMQEIDVRLDEVLLLNALNFAQTIMSFMNRRQAMNEEERWMRSFSAGAAFGADDTSVGSGEGTAGPAKMYYFELLTLNPIKVCFHYTLISTELDAATEKIHTTYTTACQSINTHHKSTTTLELAKPGLSSTMHSVYF